jgi:hypothetical protein
MEQFASNCALIIENQANLSPGTLELPVIARYFVPQHAPFQVMVKGAKANYVEENRAIS